MSKNLIPLIRAASNTHSFSFCFFHAPHAHPSVHNLQAEQNLTINLKR